MKKIFTIIAAASLALAGQSVLSAGFMIDKNSWKDVQADEKIFGYFVGPAYYLVSDKGDSIIQTFDKKDPAFSADFRKAIMFFLEKNSAISIAKQWQELKGISPLVKQVPMAVIFGQQYKTVGTPILANPATPDFLVTPKEAFNLVTVEFLLSQDQKNMATVTSGEKKYSPAFFSKADALKFQERILKETGVKFDRITLDFDTFVKTIMRPNSKTDVPVAVFGENAEELMRAFEKQYH